MSNTEAGTVATFTTYVASFGLIVLDLIDFLGDHAKGIGVIIIILTYLTSTYFQWRRRK